MTRSGLADFFGGIFADFVDVTWDLITITVFQQYVTANVFPSSASGVHVVHQPTDALAYDFPTTAGEIGWNDGDLVTWSGAAAWHMSVNQLLSIMGTFRRHRKSTPVSFRSGERNTVILPPGPSTGMPETDLWKQTAA